MFILSKLIKSNEDIDLHLNSNLIQDENFSINFTDAIIIQNSNKTIIY